MVSVIMPSYNACNFLSDAVNSVINQSFAEWELIVINDGSTDGTSDYLNPLNHPRITVINQANRGVSSARNAGLEIATGKYITFLDADDRLPPRSLIARVEFLEKHSDVHLVDGAISVRDNKLDHELREYRPGYRGRLLPRIIRLDDSVFFNVCYMFRRSVLDDVRFPEHMTHAEDLAFFMMLADKCNLTYGHVDEVVYHYRSGIDSAMSNLDGLEQGYVSLIEIVENLDNASTADRLALKLRISKILALSWFDAGNYRRGLKSALRALAA